MTVRLHIDRIVLDAGVVAVADLPVFEAAFSDALQRLLADPDLAMRGTHGAIAGLTAPPLRTPATDTRALGEDMAAAVFGGIFP
ncbi:hypothetical protein [Polymorphobacter fuscus]|uniref:Uncharacterized protein n=1 Tax=Sandarakinorhabdus fusca TaxID=1439888 RepID=A0A7C9GP54_9SPHN|nr:hypothetical protein [Polymorphobacter fuscus]KAB7647950.1 hypothetical protein F9290_08365 [Polymorphobacter fuscus]MQT17277.1 hypothetical protein [Polymorphobacter fuscus]NJC08727.1 hypothetical protein [Polymorphobacter fuscus]